MATLDQIEAEKNAAVAIVERLIDDASAKASAATTPAEQSRWDDIIDKLNARRAEIFEQAYEDQESEVEAALAALKAATAELNRVAGEMTGATAFINKLANFGSAVDEVIDALKKKS